MDGRKTRGSPCRHRQSWWWLREREPLGDGPAPSGTGTRRAICMMPTYAQRCFGIANKTLSTKTETIRSTKECKCKSAIGTHRNSEATEALRLRLSRLSCSMKSMLRNIRGRGTGTSQPAILRLHCQGMPGGLTCPCPWSSHAQLNLTHQHY